MARERVPLASLFQWHTRAMNWLKTHTPPAVISRSMLTNRCVCTSSSCSGMATDVLAAHYVSPCPRVQLCGIAPFCPALALHAFNRLGTTRPRSCRSRFSADLQARQRWGHQHSVHPLGTCVWGAGVTLKDSALTASTHAPLLADEVSEDLDKHDPRQLLRRR